MGSVEGSHPSFDRLPVLEHITLGKVRVLRSELGRFFAAQLGIDLAASPCSEAIVRIILASYAPTEGLDSQNKIPRE